MAFNFGAGLAKAAGGAAEIAGNQIKNEQTLDLQRELSDIQNAKALALEQATYERGEQRKDAEFAKVKSITDSVTDPMEGQGGYEDPKKQAARQYGLLEQKAAALRDAGKYDAADKLDKELNRIDSKSTKEGQLEIKKLMLELQGQRIEDLGKYQQGMLNNSTERLKLQGEVNDAKAANAGNETDAGRNYNAYVQDVKTNGRKDSKGNISYNPLSRDLWSDFQSEKDARVKAKYKPDEVVVRDEDGLIVKTTSKGSSASKPTASAAPKPWERGYSNP